MGLRRTLTVTVSLTLNLTYGDGLLSNLEATLTAVLLRVSPRRR